MGEGLFELLVGSLGDLLHSGARYLITGLIVGAGLALVGWWAAGRFARLWNRRYRLRLPHHLLRIAAAVVTFLAVLGWSVTSFVEGMAWSAEQRCQEVLSEGDRWLQEAHAQAYSAVWELGTENFGGVPSPDAVGSYIPLTNAASVEAVATVYARSAVARLEEQLPQVALLAERGLEVVIRRLAVALRDGLGDAGRAFSVAQAKEFVVSDLIGNLLAPVRAWVQLARVKLAALLLVTQALVFGLIGFAAYRDIKILA